MNLHTSMIATVTELADYLEADCQPRARRAVASALLVARPKEKNALLAFSSALAVHTDELSKGIIRSVRELDCARCGGGPWPAPSPVNLRAELARATHASRELGRRLEKLDAGDQVARDVGVQLVTEQLLFARAADLAPERRRTPRPNLRAVRGA